MGHGADPRSDIYSLGVVLYEMLIGQVPFHADSQVGVAMKHVNEELPDVQRRRPEVSARGCPGGRAGHRKETGGALPEHRRDDRRSRTALEVEAARAGSTTGEATSVLDSLPPPRRKLSGRARWSWGAIALLALIGGGTLLATKLISDGSIGGGGANAGKGGTIPISSTANAYDPEGDGEENDATANDAVDGNPTTTFWESEHYDSETFAGTKTGPDPGVGIYVTASSAARPRRMIVRSPTPGWDAEVFAAPSGPRKNWRAGANPSARRSVRPPRRKSTSMSISRRATSCSGSTSCRRRAIRKAATRSRSATSNCSAEPPMGLPRMASSPIGRGLNRGPRARPGAGRRPS